MTTAVRWNLWRKFSVGRLLVATAVVLGGTAFARYRDGDYSGLVYSAWITLAMFWGVLAVRLLRRRQNA